jgi:1-aminocyclopropane-1-carboxylate deaminase
MALSDYSVSDDLHRRASEVALQRLPWPSAERRGVAVWVRRDDLIDVHQSGNKFYKLYYNLRVAQKLQYKAIASFGGAWSNHLYALAFAGAGEGIPTHGIIRGERPSQLSPMLQDVENLGMELHFVGRDSYAAKLLPESLRSLSALWQVPEGGGNFLGALGMSAIGRCLQEIFPARLSVCMAAGTGTSMAGVAAGLGGSATCLGFSVLKGAGNLAYDVKTHVNGMKSANVATSAANWRLISGYHCGGYGRKLPAYLKEFLHQQEANYGIHWDPIYTIKMLWGVHCLLDQGYWRRGENIVLLHTGGMQGRRGFCL